MQLTDAYWDAINNPARRWFLYDCPVRPELTVHQARMYREDPLLRDRSKPRKPARVSAESFVQNTITHASYNVIKNAIHDAIINRTNGGLGIERNPDNDVEEAAPIIFQEVELVVNPVNNYEAEDDEALNLLHHDLQLRYSSCYFIYKEEVYIAMSFFIDNHKIKVEAYWIKKGLTDKRVILDYSESLLFTLPKLGYINFNSSAIFAERNYNISNGYKYKRGFNDASCTFYSISDRELKACNINTGLGSPINTRKIVEGIFNKDYPSYDEALEQILSFSKLSCAFSSTLCIKLESLYNKFTLLKNTWTIAEYNHSTNSWQMLTNTFNEELIKLNIPFKEAE